MLLGYLDTTQAVIIDIGICYIRPLFAWLGPYSKCPKILNTKVSD